MILPVFFFQLKITYDCIMRCVLVSELHKRRGAVSLKYFKFYEATGLNDFTLLMNTTYSCQNQVIANLQNAAETRPRDNRAGPEGP